MTYRSDSSPPLGIPSKPDAFPAENEALDLRVVFRHNTKQSGFCRNQSQPTGVTTYNLSQFAKHYHYEPETPKSKRNEGSIACVPSYRTITDKNLEMSKSRFAHVLTDILRSEMPQPQEHFDQRSFSNTYNAFIAAAATLYPYFLKSWLSFNSTPVTSRLLPNGAGSSGNEQEKQGRGNFTSTSTQLHLGRAENLTRK